MSQECALAVSVNARQAVGLDITRNPLSNTVGGAFYSGGRLEQKDAKAADVWDSYTTYLSLAVNNIYMVLDCNIILGGYVGSFLCQTMQLSGRCSGAGCGPCGNRDVY